MSTMLIVTMVEFYYDISFIRKPRNIWRSYNLIFQTLPKRCYILSDDNTIKSYKITICLLIRTALLIKNES